MRLHIDFETRSTVNLPATGVYRYFEDPVTDVILGCYAIDDQPVQTWFAPDPIPADLKDALTLLCERRGKDDYIVAHNAGFERIAFEKVMGPRYGWPVPPLHTWDDTAARAARQSLPRSLDGAANALGLSVTKDVEGKRLMMQMCRPRSVDNGVITWWTDAPRMKRLADYCAQDVEVERALDHALRPLPDDERAIYYLTEIINDRGVLVEIDFAKEAVEIAVDAQIELGKELSAITDGAVPSASSLTAMKEWLKGQGVNLMDGQDEILNRKMINTLLATPLPDKVRRVLEIRKVAGKSSVAKYQAIIDRASADGRVRGNLMYHGASTGRYTATGVQIQNLPRDVVRDWDYARETIKVAPDKLGVLSQMLRGMIIPDKGKKLIFADYASVEARGVAWLAGQKDLIDLFASGGKIYEEMAATIYKVDPDTIGKDSLARFIGKTTILGCGYSMGAAKFRMQCAAMGADIDEELATRAVSTYRSRFSRIPMLWRNLNDAAINAVKGKTEARYGHIAFYSDGNWLLMNLPSGRKIFYREPRITRNVGAFGEQDALSYLAVDSFTKRWSDERTFGGKLCENAVQGICRDLIVGAMAALENEGYHVIASVHDEVVCEVPKSATKERMLELMCTLPGWAKGFPLAAEAKEGHRYGK